MISETDWRTGQMLLLGSQTFKCVCAQLQNFSETFICKLFLQEGCDTVKMSTGKIRGNEPLVLCLQPHQAVGKPVTLSPLTAEYRSHTRGERGVEEYTVRRMRRGTLWAERHSVQVGEGFFLSCPTNTYAASRREQTQTDLNTPQTKYKTSSSDGTK